MPVEVLDVGRGKSQVSRRYRDAGLADIPHKAEYEQAFGIDKLVRFVILHGADWRKHAAEDLGKVREILLIKKGAEAVDRVYSDIVCLPSFPNPIRLPVKGRAQALYKAREVIAWAEKLQVH